MNNFSFSMTVLYTVCRLAWQNCLNNIAIFTNRKPFYDAVYVAARIAEVDAAEQLPDDQARGEAAETLRVHLSQKGKTCMEYWRLVDRYISSAYPKEEWKAKREAAGSDLYEDAVHENWDKLRTMMSNAFEFITNNAVALSAGMNMPAGFPAEFEGVKNAFNTDHDAFLLAEEAAHTGTQTKGEANDAIYEKMRLMMDDGYAFFQNNAAVRDQFVLAKLLELVGTPGGGGGVEFSGTVNSGQVVNVINNTTAEWVAGVTVRIKNTTTGSAIGPLYFYTAFNQGDGWMGQGEQLLPGQEATHTITAAEFKPFLNVQNQGPNLQSYKVEIL